MNVIEIIKTLIERNLQFATAVSFARGRNFLKPVQIGGFVLSKLCLFLTFLLSVIVFNFTIHAQKAELIVQTGHSDTVFQIAFSPDGRYIASGGDDQKVKLWEVASGKEIKTFDGHSSGIYSVAFSPDGRKLVSGSSDGAKMWDINTGVEILTLNDYTNQVVFSPDGKQIAIATPLKNAAPDDVFIVYLAGHGVSLNLNQNSSRADGDTYLYLTQEATTTDKSILSVEKTREAMAISSDELKDLMKQNKALKQVLILDTCAAGAVSKSLVGKRDLPGDQIRAIERLKDNTGFYVLMGAAADAVSYEASQYGQGILTYSLLQAMKGARLRENQFADVGMLFAYAQDTVPQMAKNIGGIQRPLIITPDTSNSFDIGKFTVEEQKQIVLPNPKPLLLSPKLLDKNRLNDGLRLTQLLKEQLREISFSGILRGVSAPLVFVDAEEMTDAIIPSGLYSIEGDTINLNLVLYRNDIQVGKEIRLSGKVSEKEQLIKQLVAEIIKTM